MSKVLSKWVWRVGISAMLGVSGVALAGKIISVPPPADSSKVGFGGWNLGNVNVVVNDIDGNEITNGFDPDTGEYDPAFATFDSYIYNSESATSTPMGVLHGKDYPVGEPSGIKIINDDTAVRNGKPENCIMTTSYLEGGFLDSGAPLPVICSSGFQTHKRFKVNFLPDSLGAAVDLVFNITSTDETETYRDYQVFQKMNNYSGSRLKGFEIQVGTGIGDNFVASSDANNGVGLSRLSLYASLVSVDPDNGIWTPEQQATFSHGLFGPEDTNPHHVPPHFDSDGFFDSRPAGYQIVDPGELLQFPGQTDTFGSTTPMESNYIKAPPSGPKEQFGPWLHDQIAPYGIFFDDDDNPETDAVLLAFWGEIDDTYTDHFHWMRGEVDNFAIVDDPTMNEWASNPVYYVDIIEDMLNLGVNYIVTIGEVDATNWAQTWDSDTSTATFTIRMIPVEDDSSGIGNPGYFLNPPPPLAVTENIGVVTLNPESVLKPDDDLLVVSLADGNAGEQPIVEVKNITTDEIETSLPDIVTLAALDEDALVIMEVVPERMKMKKLDDREGVFQGNQVILLSDTPGTDNDGVLHVNPGDLIRVTYTDTDHPEGEATAEIRVEDSTFYVIPVPSGGAAVFSL